MNQVDALCKACGKPFRWTPLTPRVCRCSSRTPTLGSYDIHAAIEQIRKG